MELESVDSKEAITMTKKEYKKWATYWYFEDIESYITIYNSIRDLAAVGLLDNSWKEFIYDLDQKLFNSGK